MCEHVCVWTSGGITLMDRAPPLTPFLKTKEYQVLDKISRWHMEFLDPIRSKRISICWSKTVCSRNNRWDWHHGRFLFLSPGTLVLKERDTVSWCFGSDKRIPAETLEEIEGTLGKRNQPVNETHAHTDWQSGFTLHLTHRLSEDESDLSQLSRDVCETWSSNSKFWK